MIIICNTARAGEGMVTIGNHVRDMLNLSTMGEAAG